MKNRMNVVKRSKQAGITNIQIAVGITVLALSLVGGLYLFKYIGQQQDMNESGEISDLKSSSVSYAGLHGGRYTNLTISLACSKDFFPAGRCVGTGASATVTNMRGGAITMAIVNLTGTDTGVQWNYPGYSNKSCIAEITSLWNNAARIDVGGTPVKTATTQTLQDTTIQQACEASNDNATIAWTFGPN